MKAGVDLFHLKWGFESVWLQSTRSFPINRDPNETDLEKITPNQHRFRPCIDHHGGANRFPVGSTSSVRKLYTRQTVRTGCTNNRISKVFGRGGQWSCNCEVHSMHYPLSCANSSPHQTYHKQIRNQNK